MVDTGLMRKDEFKTTYKIFKKKYKLNVKIIKASKIYLKKLMMHLVLTYPKLFQKDLKKNWI